MKTVTTFDQLIESRHGKIGTEKRTDFEIKAKSFAIREIIKDSVDTPTLEETLLDKFVQPS